MIWVRPTTLEVRAYCTDASTLELFDLVQNQPPDWLKNVGPNQNLKPGGTLRGCAGLRNWTQQTTGIRLWASVNFRRRADEFLVQWSDNVTSAPEPGYTHQSETATIWPSTDHIHYRLDSPWLIDCKQQLNIALVDSVWHHTDPGLVRVIPGIVDVQHMHLINVNCLIRLADNDNFTLEAGQHICRIVWLTDRRIRLVTEFDPDARRRLARPRHWFVADWYRGQRAIVEQQRCPKQRIY